MKTSAAARTLVPGEAQRTDITVKLITRFKELLAEGVLVPGSKLPPERELARQFGVSRGSLRQALKVLLIMGVLKQRVGHGTYLAASAMPILAEPLEFLMVFDSISHSELFEARLIIEPELAARAAERATMDDLVAIRNAVRAMEKAGSDNDKVVESDLAFHRALFWAAGNKVCYSMLSTIHSALSTSIGRISTLAEVEHTLHFHRAIYSAIYRRKPEEARRRMVEHLVDASNLVLQTGAGASTLRTGQALARLSRSSAAGVT